MINRIRIFTLLVVGSALASCGGDPNLTGPGPGPGADGDEPQEARILKPAPDSVIILSNPLFALDVQEILVRHGCTDFPACHGGGQAGLRLRPNFPENYADIVNVPARGEREFLLVKPFDATNSYIIIKLENRQRIGGPMPRDFRLDSIDLTNLRNWINNGALNN